MEEGSDGVRTLVRLPPCDKSESVTRLRPEKRSHSRGKRVGRLAIEGIAEAQNSNLDEDEVRAWVQRANNNRRSLGSAYPLIAARSRGPKPLRSG
jgi:hypothetical protein